MGAGESRHESMQVDGESSASSSNTSGRTATLLMDTAIKEPLRHHMLRHLSALDLSNLACVHSYTHALVMEADAQMWLKAVTEYEQCPHSHPAITALKPSIPALIKALNSDHNLRLRNWRLKETQLGHALSGPSTVKASSDCQLVAVHKQGALHIFDLVDGILQTKLRAVHGKDDVDNPLKVQITAYGRLNCMVDLGMPAVEADNFQWWQGSHKISALYLEEKTRRLTAAVVDLDTMSVTVKPLDLNVPTQTPSSNTLTLSSTHLSPCGKWLMCQLGSLTSPSSTNATAASIFHVFSLTSSTQATFEGVGMFAHSHTHPSASSGVRVIATVPGTPRHLVGGHFNVIKLEGMQVEWGGEKPRGICFHAIMRSCDTDKPPQANTQQLLLYMENHKNAGDLHALQPLAGGRTDACDPVKVIPVKHRSVTGVQPMLSPDGTMLAHLHRASHSETILLSIFGIPSGDRLIKRWANRNGALARKMLWSPCSAFLALHCRSACGRDKILVLAVPDGRTWEPFRCMSPLSQQSSFGMLAWAQDCSKLICQVGGCIYQAEFTW